MNPALKSLRERDEGSQAAIHGGLGGLSGLLNAYLMKSGRKGLLGAGGAAIGAGSSLAADALFGKKERGNLGHDALQGALSGGAATALTAGAIPGGQNLVKYLMATKGLSKGKAIAMLLGGAGLAGATGGAALGALGAGMNNLAGDED